jgi:hypothetical protein
VKRGWGCFLVSIVILVAVVAAFLAFARNWTSNELRALRSERHYNTPEEAAHIVVRDMYTDIQMVELISAQRKYGFEDLEMVVVHVWARAMADGSSFGMEDYDNVALFFLELDDGWAHVPECKGQLIAIGKHLFKL